MHESHYYMWSPKQMSVLKKAPSVYMKFPICNNIYSCIVPRLMPLSLPFKVKVNLRGWNHNTPIAAMVDCGATTLFISERFVREHEVCTHLLGQEIPLFNINRLRNWARKVTYFAYLQLTVDKSKEWCEFLMTDLGPEDVVLGLPWLRNMNPKINWAKGTMKVK